MAGSRDPIDGGEGASGDVSALFVILLAAGPLVLPTLGLDLEHVIFVVPALLLAWAAARCTAAALRVPERRRVWLPFAFAAGLGFASSVAAVIGAAGDTVLKAVFYVGAAASVALLAGAVALFRSRTSAHRPEQLLDALLASGLIAAVGVYYVAIPAVVHGDLLLTGLFLVDLVALLIMAASLQGGVGAGVGRWIFAAFLAISAADAAVAATASPPALALAALWIIAAVAFGVAADGDRDGSPAQPDQEDEIRRPYLRALAPLPVVLTFPTLAIVEVARHGVQFAPIAFFGTFFMVALVVGFGRQAYLVVDNRRTAARERQVRADATRRNEELRALSGLAATMTETLEEEAVVERGLDVLGLAARATSAALHLDDEGEAKLRATAGHWQTEAAWAGTPHPNLVAASVQERGRRVIARFPLTGRDKALGSVTLVRSADDAFDSEELRLLRLLVAQLALAILNARDYSEKLDQSIRDPLTGTFNRRFFYEALDREVERQHRYGSPLSLVLLDIDDFKLVNDEQGHAAGDRVLTVIAEIVVALIRPTDTFARIGGEEFALLLPETERLEGLLVAERIRAAVARATILSGARVRVSAGVSSCPEDGATATELGKKADDALYWAKRNGKNLAALASEVVVDAERSESDRALPHLHALVEMIDCRLRTADHSGNVARYAAATGESLGLHGQALAGLRRAALLHDVGKVAVDPAILSKPEALEAWEYAEIQRHPLTGARILIQAGLVEEARWVRHHHERIDGAGYPDGLAGDEIPLESKILFVADSFEAMTSDRPYQAGVPVEAALAELAACAGSQFDARVVDAFAALVRSGELDVSPIRSLPERAEAAGI